MSVESISLPHKGWCLLQKKEKRPYVCKAVTDEEQILPTINWN